MHGGANTVVWYNDDRSYTNVKDSLGKKIIIEKGPWVYPKNGVGGDLCISCPPGQALVADRTPGNEGADIKFHYPDTDGNDFGFTKGRNHNKAFICDSEHKFNQKKLHGGYLDTRGSPDPSPGYECQNSLVYGDRGFIETPEECQEAISSFDTAEYWSDDGSEKYLYRLNRDDREFKKLYETVWIEGGTASQTESLVQQPANNARDGNYWEWPCSDDISPPCKEKSIVESHEHSVSHTEALNLNFSETASVSGILKGQTVISAWYGTDSQSTSPNSGVSIPLSTIKNGLVVGNTMLPDGVEDPAKDKPKKLFIECSPWWKLTFDTAQNINVVQIINRWISIHKDNDVSETDHLNGAIVQVLTTAGAWVTCGRPLIAETVRDGGPDFSPDNGRKYIRGCAVGSNLVTAVKIKHDSGDQKILSLAEVKVGHIVKEEAFALNRTWVFANNTKSHPSGCSYMIKRNNDGKPQFIGIFNPLTSNQQQGIKDPLSDEKKKEKAEGIWKPYQSLCRNTCSGWFQRPISTDLTRSGDHCLSPQYWPGGSKGRPIKCIHQKRKCDRCSAGKYTGIIYGSASCKECPRGKSSGVCTTCMGLSWDDVRLSIYIWSNYYSVPFFCSFIFFVLVCLLLLL